MDGQDKSGSLLPVSSLFFAFLALGLVLVSDVPFKGTRPDVGEAWSGVPEGVRARLWEDPFAAVERYRLGSGDGAVNSFEALRQACRELDVEGESFVEIPHSLADLRCQMVNIARRKTGPGPARITVLAATVFGGPYEGAVERRMRNRYAVLSGLGVTGYVPQDAEHIGYLDFAQSCARQLEAGQTGLCCELPRVVPYEWLEPGNGGIRAASDAAAAGEADAILLLWLDDDELVRQAHPLKTLAKLYRNLDQQTGNQGIELTFKLLGPAGSSNLRHIYREQMELICGDVSQQDESLADYMQRLPIYSSSATVDKDYILGSLERNLDQARQFSGVLRTISTDRDQAQALICELERRGVDPVCHPQDASCQAYMDQSCSGRAAPRSRLAGSGDMQPHRHSGDSFGGHLAHVVLIAEWDTFYGRSLPQVFEDVVKASHDAASATAALGDGRDRRPDWLHRVTYLRGLDGKIPGLKDEGEGAGNNKSSGRQTLSSYGSDIRQPVGQSQYDYLRRLANELLQLNQRLQSANQGSVQAVGVLGSDDYDKLLILQALRKRFPGVVFFTTDLDARLLHPAEQEWARNLVVASGFGLELTPRLQGGVPPFRDAYQTSLFLATLLAAGEGTVFAPQISEKKLQGCLRPRLFEVGQRGAVDLSVEAQPAPGCGLRLSDGAVLETLYPQRPVPKLIGVTVLSGLLVIAALMLWITWFTPTLRNGMLAVITVLLLALLLYYGRIEAYLMSEIFVGEPFTFGDGVSIWPTEIVRLGGALLSVFFMVVVISRLRLSARAISGMLKLPWPLSRVEVVEPDPASDSGAGSRRELLKNNICTVGQHLLILGWGMGVIPGERKNFREVWSQYISLGYGWSCLARVIVFVVAFGVFGRLIMSILGMPQTPFRGQVSSTMDQWVIWIAVLAYLVLVFQVFDATRLARRFVHLLMQARVGWPRELLDDTRHRFGLPPVVAAEHLRLSVIQKHVQAIDPLIFYPFAVMFVIILSRSRVFDDWTFPLSLMIVIGVSTLFALSSAFLLRRAARQAKQTTLENLRSLMMMAKACEAGACDDTTRRRMQVTGAACEPGTDADTSPGAMQTTPFNGDAGQKSVGVQPGASAPEQGSVKVSDRIEMMLKEVEGLQSGPFAPLAKHPIVSALAMPFGGVGGLYLIDYLATMNW